MGAAAAPLAAEAVMAESFAVAAPSMFTAVELAPLATGALETGIGLGALEGLGGLSALGAEFGTEALFSGLGGLGEAAVPTLAEGIASGVTSGGLGAGEVGINEALVNAEQMQAVNSGFSQAELEAMQRGQEMAQNARELGQVAETGTDATGELIQNSGQIPTVEAPAYTPEPAGLEQIKEPPLSDAAQRTIEGAKTYGPATNAEYADAQLQAAKNAEVARYEETIQNLSNNGIKQIGSAGVDTTTQDAVRQKLLESSYGPDRFAGTQNLMQNAGPVQSDMLTKESLRLPIDEQLGRIPTEAIPASTIPQQSASPLTNGFNTAMDFAKKNPFSAASMAYTGMKLLGGGSGGGAPEKEEYNGPLKRYKMSPNFKGRYANPEDYQYTPKTYAEGGIASFRSGGKTDFDPTGGGKIAGDYYESMLRQQAQNMPSTKSDPGIIYDTDPDTRSLDPVSAAQIRMAKINKRANVQAQNMRRPTPLGRINLTPPGGKAQETDTTDAAHGGIMHSSLGGYAAGGNPRLLKGPGDGMSDNIPATIAGKQPARLADGEFVIPADVVSHLGNGSTEAGAKILHAMMTKVRQARTGNSKQGKQINPRKFVPT